MTGRTEQPGEMEKQLRAAIDVAVMGIPGAPALGDGDYASIMGRVSDPSMSPQDRVRLAQNFATEIAIAARDQPRNMFDGRPEPADAKNGAASWAATGLYGAMRFAGGDKGRSANGGSSESPRGTSSINYGSITGNFGLDRNGALTGFTSQMFNSQFKPIGYNEPTARGVATILGRREGLTGDALVRRTKEVGHDTRDRLGLEINTYARDVATIGKPNTEDAVQYKKMLDQAQEAFARGDREAAKQALEQAATFKKQRSDTIRQNRPDIAPNADRVYRGLDNNFLKKAPALKSLLSDTARAQALGDAKPIDVSPTKGEDRASRSEANGLFDDEPPSQHAAVAPAAPAGSPAVARAPEKGIPTTNTADASPKPQPDAKSKNESAKNDTATKTATAQPKPAAKAAKPGGVG